MPDHPPVLSRRADRFVRAWLTWREKSGGTTPSRRSVEIDIIADLLAQITVLDAVDPDTLIVRVMGTSLEAAANERPTGMNALDLSTDEIRPVRAMRMWSCASVPCGSHFRFLHVYPSGAELPFEGLTLPVRAKAEGQPMQLFTFFWRQDRRSPYDPPQNQLQTQLPDYFAYLDIGAGGPMDQGVDVVRLEDLLRGEEKYG